MEKLKGILEEAKAELLPLSKNDKLVVIGILGTLGSLCLPFISPEYKAFSAKMFFANFLTGILGGWGWEKEGRKQS